MKDLLEIEIDNLKFSNQEKTILQDVKMQIQAGDFVVLAGPTASGKSSFCHCLTGAIPKFHEADLQGQVRIKNRSLNDYSLPEMAAEIGYMLQDPQNQLFHNHVLEDVAFGPGNLNLKRKDILTRSHNALAKVEMTAFKERKPESLSGGEAQKIALASILALETSILILDQPTAELDPLAREKIHQILANLNREKKKTIILVADDIEEALKYGNRFFYFNGLGQIEEVTKEIFAQKSIIKIPSKSNSFCESKSILANINQCSYRYKGQTKKALADLDFSLNSGEVTALIGANGSGKTTLAKTLMGIIEPDQGKIEYQTNNRSYLFQNPDFQIFASTVYEEAAFALKKRGVKKEEIEAKMMTYLQKVGLAEVKNEHPQRLSRGQRQILALVSVLVQEADLIIADEPTGGLNSLQAHQIMENLTENIHGQKRALLFITHDIKLAEHYADRILIMSEGKITADMRSEENDFNFQEINNQRQRKEESV